ncbi:MAG: hypothetical protein LBF51_07410 [Zoogloeaceae bacterium]|jgi:hypothetical protein|nr:hypothetical protein [Zoogloeaceae bacterium]
MTIFSIRGFQTPMVSRIGDMALLASVILAGTVFPRLMLLGRFPVSDEGYYAHVAQQIHHSLVNGQGIPDYGGLSLYPMLCSWVFSLQYNPLISLRLIDLGVAVVMAFLLYRVLARTCNSNTGAALIAFVFTFTMNQLVFIDSGFKNSITAAFVPLLLALVIGIGAIRDKKPGSAWWMAGALTALAVVLRETFVPFALLGLVSVFIAQGKKAALQFFIGGVAAGILLIGGILIARGGAAETIAAYRAAGIMVGSVPSDRLLEYFIFYGLATIRFSSIALAFGAAAIVILSAVIFLRRDKSLLLATVFWLSFIGAALVESATKICYAYHFAIALPGLAGLCALALREIIRLWRAMEWAHGRINNMLAVTGIVLSAVWLYFSCSRLSMEHWPVTLETLIAAPGGEWPEKFTSRSKYLFMAAEIRKIIPENGTLSISRGMHALYLLTGRSPPVYRLSDLSATAFLLDFSVPDIRQALLDCAPDILVVTTMDEPLPEAVLAAEIYETAAKIPFGKLNHGYFDGVMIFRKTKETVCLEKQGMAEWLTRISR